MVRPYYNLEYVSGCKELNVDIFVVGEDWGKKTHNLDVDNFILSMGKKFKKLNIIQEHHLLKLKILF